MGGGCWVGAGEAHARGTVRRILPGGCLTPACLLSLPAPPAHGVQHDLTHAAACVPPPPPRRCAATTLTPLTLVCLSSLVALWARAQTSTPQTCERAAWALLLPEAGAHACTAGVCPTHRVCPSAHLPSPPPRPPPRITPPATSPPSTSPTPWLDQPPTHPCRSRTAVTVSGWRAPLATHARIPHADAGTDAGTDTDTPPSVTPSPAPVLDTGGMDASGCCNADESLTWTPIPAATGKPICLAPTALNNCGNPLNYLGGPQNYVAIPVVTTQPGAQAPTPCRCCCCCCCRRCCCCCLLQDLLVCASSRHCCSHARRLPHHRARRHHAGHCDRRGRAASAHLQLHHRLCQLVLRKHLLRSLRQWRQRP